MAMDDEMDSFKKNDTYELVPRPTEKTIVGGRWIYSKKGNNDETFKARYVAKGYSQKEGIDYNETFSPTARISSLRTMIDLSVQEDMIIHQMDVKTCLLYTSPSPRDKRQSRMPSSA